MIEELAKQASDSLWRKIGEKALSTAVTTTVSEVIKASIDLAKRAKLREQKAAFDDWRKQQKKADEPDEADQPEQSEADEETDEDAEEAEASKPEDGPAEDAPAEDAPAEGACVDFAAYVANRRAAEIS